METRLAAQAALDARATAVDQLRSLGETVGTEGPTAEQRTQIEALEAEVTTHDVELRSLVNRMDSDTVAANARAGVAALTLAAARGDTEARTTLQTRNEELRSLRQSLAKGMSNHSGHDFVPTAMQVNPEGRAQALIASSPQFRALALGPDTGAPGGIAQTLPAPAYTLLPTWLSFYTQSTLFTTIMRAAATTIVTPAGNDLEIPLRTTGSMVMTRTNERFALPQIQPSTLPNVTLHAYKYAGITYLSSELIQDESFDLLTWLVTEAGVGFGIGFGTEALTGTGVDQPQGLLSAATVGVTTASSQNLSTANPTPIAFNDLIALYHSVLAPYRANASWVMNDSTAASLATIKNDIGDYVWRTGVTAGEPDTLLGKPVVTDPGIPEVVLGSPTPQPVVGFGDISRAYVVRLAGEFRIEQSSDVGFATDEIAIRYIQRADGRVRDLLAFKTLAIAGD
jgi:HK97 family phage major capsid protein